MRSGGSRGTIVAGQAQLLHDFKHQVANQVCKRSQNKKQRPEKDTLAKFFRHCYGHILLQPRRARQGATVNCSTLVMMGELKMKKMVGWMENKLFYHSRQSPSANSGWKRAGARIREDSGQEIYRYFARGPSAGSSAPPVFPCRGAGANRTEIPCDTVSIVELRY